MLFDNTNGVEVTLPPLTDAQKCAVFAPDGPILADSVPGSGKTRTITCRLAYLANLYQPESILAITFTKGAAAEMSVRVRSMIKTRGSLPKVTHFHSFTYHILKELWGVKHLPIAVPKKILGKLGSIYKEQTGFDKADEKTIESYAKLISRAKSKGLDRVGDLEEIKEHFNKWSSEPDLLLNLWEQLGLWYLEHSLIDFDDMLNRAVIEINRMDDWRERLHEKYRHILVDEFQDTNSPQWALVRAIVENRAISAPEAGSSACSDDFNWHGRSLLACGDGDQSIYGFRSADISNILHFPNVYRNCLTVELKTNYRSTSTITACANRLINFNRRRRVKEIDANRPQGAKIALVPCSTEEEQTRRVTRLLLELYNGKRRVAVLSRHHDTLNVIRQACETVGIPTDSSGGVPFLETRPIQMVKRWLTSAFDLHDTGNLLAALSEAGENEIWTARAEASRLFGLSLWELVWQLPDLSDEDAEFFGFLLRLNQLLKSRRFSEATGLCFDRTNLFSELCEGRDPIRMGRLLDALQMIAAIRGFEKLPDTGKETLLNLFQNGKNSRETRSVSLLTIHASKGLEFDAAIIVDLNDGVLPQFEAEDEEEERRMFYVAITRAIDRLVLCFNKANPSRFLREVTAAGVNDFVQLDES